jgi:endonuclease YncB( thermonuclease family)
MSINTFHDEPATDLPRRRALPNFCASAGIEPEPVPRAYLYEGSDKSDRYLADVWVGDRYLNPTLLDEGLAVRVEE